MGRRGHESRTRRRNRRETNDRAWNARAHVPSVPSVFPSDWLALAGSGDWAPMTYASTVSPLRAASIVATSIFFVGIIASKRVWPLRCQDWWWRRADAWSDLPGEAPPVLAPAAGAFLAAVVDDRVPVAVGLGLISACSNECLAGGTNHFHLAPWPLHTSEGPIRLHRVRVRGDRRSSSTEADFDDYWSPFPTSIAPSDAYCASLDDDAWATLREACFRRLGSPSGVHAHRARLVRHRLHSKEARA